MREALATAAALFIAGLTNPFLACLIAGSLVLIAGTAVIARYVAWPIVRTAFRLLRAGVRLLLARTATPIGNGTRDGKFAHAVA